MKRFLFPIIFLCSLSTIALSQDSGIENDLKDLHRGTWDQFPVGDHGIIVSPRTLVLFTGTTGYAEISLDARPSAPVELSLWDYSYTYENQNQYIEDYMKPQYPDKTFYPTTPATFSPASMVFTPDNWNVPQKLVVTAPGADTNYAEFYDIFFEKDDVRKAAFLSIHIQAPPSKTNIVPSTTTLQIGEGRSTSFDVRFSNAPDNKRHIFALDIISDNPYIRVDPSRLYFHPGHKVAWNGYVDEDPPNIWSNPQTVRVYAEHDSDSVSERSKIILGVRSIGDQQDSEFATPTPTIIAPDKIISLHVTDDDVLSYGRLILSPSGSMTMEEGDAKRFTVRLEEAPSSQVMVNLSSDNPDVTVSPRSLIIYPSAWDAPQSVSVSARVDSDMEDDRASIFLNSHGGASIGREQISILVRDNHPTPSTQVWGNIVLAPDDPLPVNEGKSEVFFVSLSTRPNAEVMVDISSDNPILALSTDSLVFNTSNWKEPRFVTVSARDNTNPKNEYASVFITASGGITAPSKRLPIIVIDNDPPPYSEVRSQSLALPSSASGDSATLRVQCKQDTPCPVTLDCSTQDGTIFRGDLPQPIPPWETRSLDMVDIERYTGGFSWSGKGRLGCSLLSTGNISSQVWTRSGDGVLVNNSAAVRSDITPLGGFRADIESIPSPDSTDESNIRLRCISPFNACIGTKVNCFDDSGNKYEGYVGTIEPLAVRHIQAEELADMIGYRWKGLGLSCEIHSSEQFTAQVLTRTGGGGGLVNNSATSNLANSE
ncbi:MAG: hypothetical protein ISN28_09590 [Ectothiorhodospiraceae bacterium AqS1]|nr:hypothetical protein [Ectothiorhodospiraceae bacterium AqS1]